jgi:glycosyltransferase involved in cell wall biosynthesis
MNAVRAPAKVALVAPRYAPQIGGVERVVEMQARELTRRGLTVEVITTDPTRSLARLEERDGVLVRRFPTVANDGVYFISPWLGAWLSAHAADYAVVHAHSYHTPVALQASVASRRARVPFVLTTHYHGTGHTRLRRWLHGPYRPLGGWLLRTAAWVLCVSAVEQVLLRQHFGERPRTLVTPNAIDTDELSVVRSAQRAQPRAAGLEVLAIGRLDSYKQPDRLIAALPHLPADAQLTIVGEGPARPSLQRLATTLGVAERVHLLGHQTRAALLERYRTADTFASLSRNESFGLAVLEAAVAGLPVVASDISAHRELAGYAAPDRVRLIPLDSSPRALAEALLEAAGRGRAHTIQGWPLPTWDQHAELLLGCYRSAEAHV